MAVTRATATRQQTEALDTIVRVASKFGGVPEVVVINGPAGTGKTSLLRLVEDEIGESIITAPTGKAALRVREATGCDAQTYHKTLYKPRTDEVTGEVEFIPKESGDIGAPDSGVWIGDESSMLNEDLFNETLQMCQDKRLNLVLLGDNFQLPAVNDSFNVLSRNFRDNFAGILHYVNLTEVRRQALDSYVLRASVLIRQDRLVEAFDALPSVPEAGLLDKAEEVLAAGGVVICHSNKMRHQLNRALRERRGFTEPAIQTGEPMLVLRNNYHVDLFNGEGTQFVKWTNGPRGPYNVFDKYKQRQADYQFGRALIGDEGDEKQVVLCQEEIAGLVPEDGVGMGALSSTAKKSFGKRDPYLHANFGYTLTAHKSQGSEWPVVLVVIEPSVGVATHSGRRWLYTAVTRAKQDVSICMLPPNP